MLTLSSNLRLQFEEMGIRYQAHLRERGEELDRAIKKAIDTFDIEKAINVHVQLLMEESLNKVFDEIDITESLKVKIWSEIEKQIGD